MFKLLKQELAALTVLLATSALQCVEAGVSPDEAAKLGRELTSIGAIRGGNAEGTIPEWTGSLNFTDQQKRYTVADVERLRQERPEELEGLLHKPGGGLIRPVEINKSNLKLHAGRLTEGHKALLNQYPSYRMLVYPTVRTAFFPEEINQATVANATRARLEGIDSVKDARLGFPFPIPKSGAEAIWNHKLKFRGSAARRYNNQAIVKPNGEYLITKLTEDVKFKYANLQEPGNSSTQLLLAYYLAEVLSPPRVAGQITLVHETADQSDGGRVAWIYSPGFGRVNRAPQVGFDNPSVGTDNEQYNDQVDVFNGSLSRYDWKLIGRKEIYIPYNSYLINSPKVKYKDILKPHHINSDLARYELHRVWVVDATLRNGLRHNFARRTFYIDEDSWSIAAVDCYDARGRLWKFQEAHLLTAPFVPTVTGIPELIYDLQSKRYFATALANEEAITDFNISFPDSYFDPANLKRKARGK